MSLSPKIGQVIYRQYVPVIHHTHENPISMAISTTDKGVDIDTQDMRSQGVSSAVRTAPNCQAFLTDHCHYYHPHR
jgi:hypothetical protein